jgi:CoA-transferase family III
MHAVDVAPTETAPHAVRVTDRWAACGGMWLTGPANLSGLGPPRGLIDHVDELAARIAAASSVIGRRVSVDSLQVLTERAAWAGLGRAGQQSCGGATRLLKTNDGWVALTLARPDDAAMVPALVEGDVSDPWVAVEAWGAGRPVKQFVERAALLSLPVAALGERTGSMAVTTRRYGRAQRRRSPDAASVVVADLSSMWAGPLCAALLAEAGCTVIKIESTTRPDGARMGPQGFFDLLHHRKHNLGLAFGEPGDRELLARVLRRCDVVIEASRPRALQQLGVDRAGMMEELLVGGPQVWVSITGHGSSNDRVGFGDDAAVAGGLVAWHDGTPQFCADAVGDPISGLAAAAATMEAIAAGVRCHLDVSMAGACAAAAGPTLAMPADAAAMRPSPSAAPGTARPLGADNAAVLHLLGLG